MAMKSMLWGAPTSGDGATAYTEAETTRLFRALVGGDPTNEGVLWGVYNGFAVTGASSPVTVDTGAAFVYGYFAWDESTTTIVIPTPVVGTTGHRIVLRQSVAAKTVRLTLVSSTDGVATLPAITQTAGTTWDTKVYGLTITTGGVITLTDERAWCHFPTRVETAMVENNAITDALIRDSAGLSVIGRAGNTTGDPADITAGTDAYVLLRSGTSLIFGQVQSGGIGTGQVTADKIANRTRKIFVPAKTAKAHPSTFVAQESTQGVVMADGITTYSYFNFQVPVDFVSGMTIKAVVVPGASGDMYSYIQGWYAAVGESATGTHSFVTTPAAIAVTGSYINEICSVSLPSASAGDYVQMEFVRNGGQASDTVNAIVYIVGIIVEYTADS